MSGKLIMYPLMMLIFCAVLAQLINLGNIGFITTTGYNATSTSSGSIGSYIASGGGVLFPMGASNTNSSYSVPSVALIGADGLLALLIGFVAIGVTIGISILGSGLSESSQNILYKSIVYYAIWGIFSVFAYNMGVIGISNIPTFGSLIYLFMTIVYTVGVQQQINTHEGS